MIQAVAANLNAGYSIENAIRETYKDLSLLYGRKSRICQEVNKIYIGLDNNRSFEEMMMRFAEETDLEEIRQFVNVFTIAKKSGGSLHAIISDSVATISGKLEVEREIQVMISSKKLEQKIMNLIPFLIIFYIEITSNGYFDILYHNVLGIVIMTICLVLYLAAYLAAKKMISIQV
ncbi:MAG: type II secretion system F family protein [Lachnospiraceae bacterium]|nr:type II secretion system F family protein [Lachnospiraceae bacterium]